MSAFALSDEQNLASEASPIYALFRSIVTERLTRDHLALLASGSLATIRVPGFFSGKQCQTIMQALQSCTMGSYDEQRVQPRVPKLGPAAYDYYGGYEGARLPDAYWEHAQQSEETRAGLLHGPDPLTLAMDRLADAWEGSVLRATAGGQQLFAGMIREINHGMKMHMDDIVREVPGALDATPMTQLAFNVHFAMPESGGESEIHQRRWKPSDELPENRDTYGYAEHIITDEPKVALRAETGDATFFDSRNYHVVRPNTAEGRRVTMSFFIGVTANGPLIIWS